MLLYSTPLCYLLTSLINCFSNLSPVLNPWQMICLFRDRQSQKKSKFFKSLFKISWDHPISKKNTTCKGNKMQIERGLRNILDLSLHMSLLFCGPEVFPHYHIPGACISPSFCHFLCLHFLPLPVSLILHSGIKYYKLCELFFLYVALTSIAK